MNIEAIKKINFRQPKYILPLLIYIPLLGIGFAVFKIFDFEKPEKVNAELETTEYLNPNLPSASVSANIKGKYKSMVDAYGNISDLTAVDNVYMDSDYIEKESYDTKYSEEETQALAAEQQRKLEEMEALLASKQAAGTTPYTEQDAAAAQIKRQEEELKQLREALASVQQGGVPAGTSTYSTSTGTYNGTSANGSAGGTSYDGTTHNPGDPAALGQQPGQYQEPVEAVKKVKVSSDYFNTLSTVDNESNVIKAIVDEEIKATDGSRVRLRLLDDIIITDNVIPKGTYLYATMSGFGSQRAKGSVKSIMLDDQLIKISLSIYDTDGLEGLYIPKSNFREAAKDVGTSAISNTSMLTRSSSYDGSNLSQWRNQALSNATMRASNALSRNVRKNSATIKYGTQVYLINSNQQ